MFVYKYRGDSCIVVDWEYIEKYDLVLIDYIIDNGEVIYSIFRNDLNQYFALEGEY